VTWARSLAVICVLSLKRRYSLSLGVGLHEEPAALWMELGVDLDDRPADRQHPGGELDRGHGYLDMAGLALSVEDELGVMTQVATPVA
jgi:hypothetical protein